jgi:hypothetical protein
LGQGLLQAVGRPEDGLSEVRVGLVFGKFPEPEGVVTAALIFHAERHPPGGNPIPDREGRVRSEHLRERLGRGLAVLLRLASKRGAQEKAPQQEAGNQKQRRSVVRQISITGREHWGRGSCRKSKRSRDGLQIVQRVDELDLGGGFD